MDRECNLCGLGCGAHPLQQRVAETDCFFCCLGCLNVYLILSESGALKDGQDARQTELFQRSLRLGLISNRVSVKPTGEAANVPPLPTEELVLHVTGMWCTSCAWLIEHALASVPGVVQAEVSFASDLTRVRYQPQITPPEHITKRIESLGYTAREYADHDDAADAERHDLIVRTGISAFLWANIMSYSLALYTGYFQQIPGSVRRGLPFLVMALATPVVFYCAQPVLRLGWRGLLHGTIRMECLLSLGILAAYGYSVAQAFRGEIHLYFDTATAIVTFVLAGKLVERGAKETVSQWIGQLHRMMPNKVRLLVKGVERFVAVEALTPGQIFIVKAGERIPADGCVIEGESHSDESLLTGESAPVGKKCGDRAVAGSINLDGVLSVQATRSPGDSTLSNIIALVEQALSSRTDLERAADRVSRIFVPSVVLIALLTFFFTWATGSLTLGEALMRAITVLVIACPCALGLATPLAVTAALGAASRTGILVREGRVLETLRKIDTIILDKTGTVTEGKFSLLDLVACEEASAEPVLAGVMHSEQAALKAPPYPQCKAADDRTLSLLASIERHSEHPLGVAVTELARWRRTPLLDATSVKIHKGRGISGVVAGTNVFAGNRRLMNELAISIDDSSRQQADAWEEEGKTVSFVGWDGRLQALAAFGDRPKPEAIDLVAELKRRRLNVQLVSGDSCSATQWIASYLHTDSCQGEVLPEEKADVVKRLQELGAVVAMVGDGINDAPALAQADLGIAMGSGTDIAMKAAAVVLMNGSLQKILKVFDISRRTMQVVRQNLFWAFFYNTLGIALAVTGVLNPIMAASAMLLSSLSVVGNSLRVARK